MQINNSALKDSEKFQRDGWVSMQWDRAPTKWLDGHPLGLATKLETSQSFASREAVLFAPTAWFPAPLHWLQPKPFSHNNVYTLRAEVVQYSLWQTGRSEVIWVFCHSGPIPQLSGWTASPPTCDACFQNNMVWSSWRHLLTLLEFKGDNRLVSWSTWTNSPSQIHPPFLSKKWQKKVWKISTPRRN